jgi:hypothetical protein
MKTIDEVKRERKSDDSTEDPEMEHGSFSLSQTPEQQAKGRRKDDADEGIPDLLPADDPGGKTAGGEAGPDEPADQRVRR